MSDRMKKQGTFTAEMHSADHLAVQFLHCDKIKGLQGVSGGSDEIQADVDSCVTAVKQGSFYFELLFKILFKLGIDILKNGFIAVQKDSTDIKYEHH